jgi:amino acid permease
MAFIGVSGILIFIVCLVITFFDEMFEREWNLDHEMKPFPSDWLQVATVIPNIMLALSFQMNFFPIYKGNNTLNLRFKKQ